MSEQYGVAAETLRQALDVLRGDGLIATQSTCGTFVLGKHRERVSDGGPSAERLEQLSQRWLACGKLALLQAHVMNLYHSTGQPYPYEDGITEPGRQVG